MSFIAKLYIGFVLSLGAVALSQGLVLGAPQDVVRFCCYLLLGIPASCLKVRLPGVTGTMSVLFLFLLAGVVELGLSETLVIGAICVVAQSFWHARVRPRPVQLLFSVATISIAVSAAYWAYHSSLLALPYFSAPLRLAVTVSVLFVANTLPIAIVIALTERKSIRDVWAGCYSWSFSYYLVGAAIVSFFTSVNRLLDWQAWVLILPVVYLIYRSYRLYLDQLQSERTRAEDERKHSQEVAGLHEQTVQALKSVVIVNARLNAVIQASPLATLALDSTGTVTSWNKKAEDMFGWSPDEAIGKHLPLEGGRFQDTIGSIIENSLRGELVSGRETTQWRKDGSAFDSAIWTAPLGNSTEDAAGVLVTVADLSDRKRLEEQLRLSQKMEAVGRLAGGIAHDFNNLLTVINGYSSMLADSEAGNAHLHSQAEEILTAGTRAAELVSQLLSFSRRQLTQPKPLEINKVVQETERMLRRVITEHIDLRTDLDQDAGWIEADLNQIQGILLNLATNARDAMPHGGVLAIETARVEVAAGGEHPAEADLSPGSYVCLVVRDTGTGMDRETQRHIFEPFFTTKQTGKGTGLGLASVYGSVHQNKGHIFMRSELGQGATFSVYLPRLERPNLIKPRNTLLHVVSKGSETILLVEDESAVRRMLYEGLTRAGYRVWEASNGAEAIRRFGEQIGDVDLLVTDIVMPVMNGLRLAEDLRGRRPGLKVIFMSGHAAEVIDNQSGTESKPDVLQKPFLPDVLVQQVRKILDQVSGESRGLQQG